VTDFFRSRKDLIAENAFLRQQVIILHRQKGGRVELTAHDRRVLVLLAHRVWGWKDALHVVQPDTLLRWHRQGFKLYWRRKSKGTARQPRIPEETIALIKEMAVENRLWGSPRIRDELRRLGIRVSKRTIQKYMRQARRGLSLRRKVRRGPPFWLITRQRSGHAILCRLMTCSSGRSFYLSSSNLAQGGSSMSISPDPRVMPGWHSDPGGDTFWRGPAVPDLR
jgi:hypothetical protein